MYQHCLLKCFKIGSEKEKKSQKNSIYVALPLVQVLMETDNTGTVQAVYTYGNDLIAMNRADANSYYHYDGLGSTRQLTGDSGTVVALYTYDGFGNLIVSIGSSPIPL